MTCGTGTINNLKLFCCIWICIALLAGGCERPVEPNTLALLRNETGLWIPGAENFTITKDLSRQGGGKRFRSLEAVDGDQLLKIEIMADLTRTEAENMQQQRMNTIRSLFTNLPIPYPGMVTNTVVTDEDLRPQLQMVTVSGRELPVYILLSNDRYTYGTMPARMVAFLGGLCFVFDESRGILYRFDYFVPKGMFHGDEFTAFYSGLQLSGTDRAGRQAESATSDAGPAVPARPPASLLDHETPLRFKDYNLILIAFEPLGASHMSLYGYNRQTTPNLDAFARDALVFENVVSPSSWSLPVFMSWFTSLYPSQHKVTNQYSTFNETEQILARLEDLSPKAVTLPQILQQHGYRTAGFTGGASLDSDFGFAAGFERYYDEINFSGFDTLMPMALSWLQEHRNERFFLFLQGYDVHGRFPVNSTILTKYLPYDYHGDYTGSGEEYWQLRTRSINGETIDLSENDVRFWRAVYDAKIYAADQRFGKFIEQLKTLDVLEKTIIVVSAGSGNEHYEHGRIDHGFSLYEELLHVPLIIRIPQYGGKRISALVRTIDIMPTVLELLNLPVSPETDQQMQGVSLVPFFRGEQINLDGISETDYLLHSFKRSIKTNEGWKFIISLDTEKRELYDLKKDPGEQQNIVQENGRIAYELEQKLFKVLQKKPFEQ